MTGPGGSRIVAAVSPVAARQCASAVVGALAGAAIAVGGYRLGLGTPGAPDSGFLPFWIGLLLTGLSIALLVTTLVSPPAAQEHGDEPARPRKVVEVLVVLAGYAVALETGGFLLTTLLLLLYLFRAIEPQPWWVVVTGAVATTAVTYLLFRVWLGAELPAGRFGLGW